MMLEVIFTIAKWALGLAALLIGSAVLMLAVKIIVDMIFPSVPAVRKFLDGLYLADEDQARRDRIYKKH